MNTPTMTKPETEATPTLPIRFVGEGIIHDANDNEFCLGDLFEDDAFGALIVRCVNSHAALVEALRSVEIVLSEKEGTADLLTEIRDALTLAGEA